MAQANDWQNVVNEARDLMAALSSLDLDLTGIQNFYLKNQSDDYWTSLGADDPIGETGLTKTGFILIQTFLNQWYLFLDGGSVSPGDYRAIVEQTRSTD